MAFSLHHDDASLTEALRRIAGAELAAALKHAPGDKGAVHDSRKRVKKLRALLRLVRAGFPDGAAENALLRDAAGGLSALRDAEVMLATHDRLLPEGGAVRAHLVQRMERAAADPAQAARTAAFRAVLAGVQSRVGDWRVKGREAEVLAAGLAKTRARAVQAMAAARKSRDPEALHDWRKRVKDGWYQARLLEPVWPEVMKPLEVASNRLGEALGDHHGLAVFEGWLDSLPGGLAAEAAELRVRARRAQGALEVEAFALGARVHAGNPAGVAALWVAWWDAWKRMAD